MTDVTSGGFPRRDDHRRIVALRDLLAVTVAGVVAGAAALVLLDLVFSLLGLGEFGQINGWLAVVLPIMQLVEEFRAWKGVPGRIVVALAATGVATVTGLLASGLTGDLPPVASGGIGALTFTVVYAPAWFIAIRMVAGSRS